MSNQTWPELAAWYCQLVGRFREVLQAAPTLPAAEAERVAKQALQEGVSEERGVGGRERGHRGPALV